MDRPDNEDLAKALHEAISRGDLATLKQLIAQGADPNQSLRSVTGTAGTPLSVAVMAGEEDIARWLLDQRVTRGPDFPQIAVYAGSSWPTKFGWLARQLIEGGADLNALDQGTTAMHMIGTPELLDLALAHGGNINVKADDGATPLHFAVQAGSEHVVALLLDRGADPLAKDRKGKTPLDYAKAFGKEAKSVVALLSERAGVKPTPPKKGSPKKVEKASWKKVEDDLVERTSKAIAAFAKKHKREQFGRFALDCNCGSAEALPSLQPADADAHWEVGDWKYQAFAAIELDLDGLADAGETKPFMEMACRALVRLEKEKAFAVLAQTSKFETLAIDHDEEVATALRRRQRIKKR